MGNEYQSYNWLNSTQPHTNPGLQDELIEQYKEQWKLNDKARIVNASYNPYYQLMLEEESPQQYLRSCPFNIAKLLSQIRTSGVQLVYLATYQHTFWTETKTKNYVIILDVHQQETYTITAAQLSNWEVLV